MTANGLAGSRRFPIRRLPFSSASLSINSVAVTPSADLIAISVASRLNIGRIKDAVYVLRASDGAEVFRQYLPLYTRTQVLFPTNETLLYSTGEKTLLVRIVR